MMQMGTGNQPGLKHRLRHAPWLAGNPEWEAMKASCRNLTHHQAVEETAELTNRYRRLVGIIDKFAFDLDAIFGQLRSKKVPFVLSGAFGISGWTGRPRATHDVDILVRSGRTHRSAVNAIANLYPQLERRELDWITAFFVPGERLSVIEIAVPHCPDLLATIDNSIRIEEAGNKYRIPTLEAALANKYGATLTLTRDAGDRMQDLVDLWYMVKRSQQAGSQTIDISKLRELGSMFSPANGLQRTVKLALQGILVTPDSLPNKKTRDQ